jgi:hypothetical protein
MLGVDLPIVQAPMGWIARVRRAVAEIFRRTVAEFRDAAAALARALP